MRKSRYLREERGVKIPAGLTLLTFGLAPVSLPVGQAIDLEAEGGGLVVDSHCQQQTSPARQS